MHGDMPKMHYFKTKYRAILLQGDRCEHFHPPECITERAAGDAARPQVDRTRTLSVISSLGRRMLQDSQLGGEVTG